MKVRVSIILNDEEVEGITREINIKPEEVAPFLKGFYTSEFPQYADVIQVEMLEGEDERKED